MVNYSPFDKSFKALTSADLAALKGVQEGWYVEYKREVPNTNSIAKSISALSNTYGGWLFYGIQEKSKDDPVADTFPGIPKPDLDAHCQRIRQAVATLLAPSPHFELRLLHGPCDAIGLLADHSIISILVPRSTNTPHVHKNGIIYRRVSDSSEPKPENDRFTLDQLWSRGDEIKKIYSKWIKKDPKMSKHEKKATYLRLFFVPDLWGDHNIRLNLSLPDVRKIMRQEGEKGKTIPFEHVQTTSNGFLARQIFNNSPHQLGLTWRLWDDAASEILLPINRYEVHDIETTAYELSGYDESGRFEKLLINQNYASASLIDLNFLFSMLIGAIRIQQSICESVGWADSWSFKCRLLNVWRTTPFIDIDAVLDEFSQHGVPMCIDKDITVPSGYGPDSFATIETFTGFENPDARTLLKAHVIFAAIAKAMGIPGWLHPSHKGTDWYFHSELENACDRALKAQIERNERPN